MEFVYVVPREDLFPDSYPYGLVPFTGEDAGTLSSQDHKQGSQDHKQGSQDHKQGSQDHKQGCRDQFIDAANRKGFFVERARAEQTPAWKQVIPYGVVVCEDRILVVRRLAKGGESRLHDKLSIGIGGHINPVDDNSTGDKNSQTDAQEIFNAAALRELEEELTIEGTYTTRTVGVLNDDSNPVGAVHVGLVLVVQVRGTVEIRETDVLAGEWATADELRERLAAGANFETWSQLLVEQIDSFLPHTVLPVS